MKFRGCKFDPHDTRDIAFTAGPVKLPKRIDNRAMATPIRNQGAEGSCVGFSVAKTVEVAFKKQSAGRPDLSERWAYEYAKRYDEWPGNNYEGSSVRGGLKGANKVGICTENFWPYKPNKRGKPRPNAAENAEKHKVIKYTRITGINNIKAAIHRNGVVASAAMVHEGWFRLRHNGVIPLKPKFDMLGGHAFVLVGYGGVGFWVANSWGTRWGKRGFGVLTYKDARLHLVDAWTIQIAASEPEPEPAICDKCGRPLSA
jgi:C1A family cysteine protease